MPANKEGYYRKLRADEQLIYEQAQMIRSAKSLREQEMLDKIQLLEDRALYLAEEFPENESLIRSTISEMNNKTTEFLNFKSKA